MGSMSIWHWVIVALVVLLLFGKGRISEMMGDLAKGIKSFKKGMADDDLAPTPQAPPAQVTQQPAPQPTPEQAPR
jgi:sec-independent protein translocase protein TatA